MGLFSKLRAAPAPDTSLAKAVLMPAVLTMIADGDVDDGELHQLQNICAFSPIFRALDPQKVMGLIKEVMNDLQTKETVSVIETAKMHLTMPMRETAMVFAMRIALADGRIDDNEEKALMAMGQRFEIPEANFMKMFEVISMLQRRPALAA